MSIRRTGAVPALAAALAVTGCAVGVDPVAVPPGSGGTAPASATGPDKVVGRYTKVNDTCPTLDGDTAQRLKLPAAGKPAEVNADTPLSQIVTCTWGTGVGSVTALVTIDRHRGSPTAEERTVESFEAGWQESVAEGRTLSPQPAGGVGDKSYIGVHRDRQSIVLSFRASNAQVLVSYGVAEMPPNSIAAKVDRTTGSLVALGRDVLDDLA